MTPYRLCAGLAIAVLVCSTNAQAARADKLDDILNIRGATHRENQKAQQQIDKLSDEAKDLLGQYRVVVQQGDSLKVYNGQLRKLIASQESEKAKIQANIDGIADVEQGILPLMEEMVKMLDQFTEADLPFLLDERRKRVADLKELLGRADVTTAEKYRLLIEAFQIENNFGHTIEAYQGDLDVDGEAHKVDFLRIGRVALFYQTPDRETSGMWDRDQGRFVEIDGYGPSIQHGLRIARKQAPPDLLLLPVPAAGNSETAATQLAGDAVARAEVGQ